MLALAAFLGAAAYLTAPVSAHAASQLAIELVTAQFKGAGIVPNVLPKFEPIGTFAANYTATVPRFTTGAALSAVNTTDRPEISIKGTAKQEADTASVFNEGNNATARFTVLLIDGNYPGSENPNGYNLHWLANNYQILEDRDHALILGNATVVIPYAGPAPPEGTGPHRYIFLAYTEPEGFSAPASPAPNSGVQLFDLAAYVAAAKLGDPIAGTYFTVETGTSTVSIAATTSIDSGTLPAATASTASGEEHHSGSETNTATTTTTTTTGAAVRRHPYQAAALGGLVAALGAVLLF